MSFLSLFWIFLGILSFSCIITIYIYFELAYCVRTGKDVPAWIYKIGQAFRHRNFNNFDNITDATALKEATFFIVRLIIVNLLYLIVMFHKTHNIPYTTYKCLKAQFGLVIVTMFIQGIIKFISVIRNKSNKPVYVYASTNAVIGSIFFTSFVLALCLSMSGIPVKPISVQLGSTNVIIGETKASKLLSSGYTFKDRTADDIIVNKRNDHFYYGDLVEIMKDGKSYGHMFLTPNSEDTDKLKNCVVTFYRIAAQNEELDKVKFNNTALSQLSYRDFKTKRMASTFSVNPFFYKENMVEKTFYLTLQTDEYILWKSYRIVVNFRNDESPYQYSVGAQHIKWE